MTMELCVLGSGSSGNSTVLRYGRRVLLIDAGFGPRATARRLSGTGVDVADIAALCLTHLDTDHFNPNWLLTLARLGIRIFCHEGCVPGVLAAARAYDGPALFSGARKRPPLTPQIRALLAPFTDRPFEPVPGVQFSPLRLAHDQEGSHGFVIQAAAYRVGYATDLGHVPESLIAHFSGVDLLALESNYDPEMEETSARPYYLKQRIMGGAGHLSNAQAFEAVRRILAHTEKHYGPQRLPRHIVLLHRSRQCNCPNLLRRLFAQDQRIAPVLTLADQHARTQWLHVGGPRPQVAEQLSLAL